MSAFGVLLPILTSEACTMQRKWEVLVQYITHFGQAPHRTPSGRHRDFASKGRRMEHLREA